MASLNGQDVTKKSKQKLGLRDERWRLHGFDNDSSGTHVLLLYN